MEDHDKLRSPAAHTLPELFKALKWGRTVKEQELLLLLASSIENKKLDGNLIALVEAV